jgi:hypothetical protein
MVDVVRNERITPSESLPDISWSEVAREVFRDTCSSVRWVTSDRVAVLAIVGLTLASPVIYDLGELLINTP